MTVTEKVAYLKGLAEGLGIDTEKSKEGKLLAAIIDVLDDMSLSIEDLEDTTEALADELDEVEDDLYGEDDDECCCDEDDDFFEVECPNCGEPLEIDEDVLDAGVIECPACKQKFALDLYDDEDECGCGCCEEKVVEEVPEPKKPAKKAEKKSEKKAEKKSDKK